MVSKYGPNTLGPKTSAELILKGVPLCHNQGRLTVHGRGRRCAENALDLSILNKHKYQYG